MLWPPELEGEALLDFFVPAPKTPWQWLLSRLWPTTRWRLSAKLWTHLEESGGVLHAGGKVLPEP